MLDKLEKKFDANTFALAVESKVKIHLKMTLPLKIQMKMEKKFMVVKIHPKMTSQL